MLEILFIGLSFTATARAEVGLVFSSIMVFNSNQYLVTTACSQGSLVVVAVEANKAIKVWPGHISIM